MWLHLCVKGFEFSVFEVNIRFVGGMLACYALTGDLVGTSIVLSVLFMLPVTLMSHSCFILKSS